MRFPEGIYPVVEATLYRAPAPKSNNAAGLSLGWVTSILTKGPATMRASAICRRRCRALTFIHPLKRAMRPR